MQDIEIIDLDELEKDMEEEVEEENDAWYPDFKILSQVEQELFGKRSY